MIIPTNKREYEGLNPEERKLVERRLAGLGFAVEPNGQWDAGTETALAAYHQNEGAFPESAITQMIGGRLSGFKDDGVKSNKMEIPASLDAALEMMNVSDTYKGREFEGYKEQSDKLIKSRLPEGFPEKEQSAETVVKEKEKPNYDKYVSEGITPLAAIFEKYKPVRDEEYDKRMKKAAAFRAVGNALRDIIDLAGGQGLLGGGTPSSAVVYQDRQLPAILNSIEKDRLLYEQRAQQWRNAMLSAAIDDMRRKEIFGQQKELLDTRLANQRVLQDKSIEKQFALAKYQNELRKGLEDFRKGKEKDLWSYRYGEMKDLEAMRNKSKVYLKLIEQAAKDNKGKYPIYNKDNLNEPDTWLDKGQIDKAFSLLQDIASKSENTDIAGDLKLILSQYKNITAAEKALLVTKYWDKIRDKFLNKKGQENDNKSWYGGNTDNEEVSWYPK